MCHIEQIHDFFIFILPTGMILFAVASFSCTLPHFIFGDQLLHASNVFNGGGSGSSLSNSSNMNLCKVGENHTRGGESSKYKKSYDMIVRLLLYSIHISSL